MRIPFWKIWLSHLFEISLEKRSSKYNPNLYLSLDRGRFQLGTNKAVYSYEDKYDNYFRIFKQVNFKTLPSSELLILGFGLGSIPYILENHYNKQFEYTAVEIDEVVIELYQKYMAARIASPIDLHQGDAGAFIKTCQKKFSIIAMDVFLDDVIPEKFQQTNFLLNVKNLLDPNGLLLYNRLASTDSDIENSQRFFDGPFKEVFKNGVLTDVGGNFMLSNKKLS